MPSRSSGTQVPWVDQQKGTSKHCCKLLCQVMTRWHSMLQHACESCAGSMN